MAESSLPGSRRPEPKAFLRDLPSYAVSESVADIKARFGLNDVVYLASNENPFGCSPKVKSTLTHALDNSHRYPDGVGRELKAALGSGLGLPEEQILLGNGSNEILDSVIKGFLGQGDEMLVSAHSFAMYPIMAQWVGADVRQIPMRHWQVDLDALSAAVSDKTRLILIANANNPTGTMVPVTLLERFLAGLRSDVLVLIDEAYIEFAEPTMGDAVSLLDQYPNLVVCRTFSKAYGLAGFRIGYGLGHCDVIEVLEKIRQPFNVNLLAMRAAVTAYHDQEFLGQCVRSNAEERQRLTEFLQQKGLTPLPSQANFVTFALPGCAEEAYQYLLSKGVIVRRLRSYDMADWLRVSIGSTEENSCFMAELATYLETRNDR